MTTTTLTPPPPRPLAIDGKPHETKSQSLARAVTSGTTNALTLHAFANCGDALDASDLVPAMKRAGDEAVAGDLARTERMLANQLLTLDAMFNNLAMRSTGQSHFKNIELLTRLALKAQSQARATAETLGMLKNPMPFIKQTNIANGAQQVNNGIPPAHTGEINSVPNKQLLEEHHNGILDTRTTTTASRSNTGLEAVGEVNRPNKRRGQGKGGA
jgi:hypothetical protein